METQIQFAEELSKRVGCTRLQATRILQAISDLAVEALSEGRQVRFTGVGTLKVVVAAARGRRNPKTNTMVWVPEHRKVKFLPSSMLHKAMGAFTVPMEGK